MSRSRTWAGLELAWELARFLGLFALLLLRFRATLADDPTAVLWLLALGSPQLLVPASLAFFLLSPRYRALLLPFLRLAKVLQLFPMVLLTAALPFGPGLPRLPFLRLFPQRLAVVPLLLAVCLLDLVFLFNLFLQHPEAEKPPA